jgi:hypothetical protein
VGAVIEPAASGRARCRGCAQPIAKGELRLGDPQPNPFGEGETTLWLHLECAAYKRPEPLLAALAATSLLVEQRDWLEREAQRGVAHHRLPRVDGAERATTARATCRACRKPIEKGAWRIRLVFFEELRFEPSGFVHLACARDYFETADLVGRLRRFSAPLSADDWAELERGL